MSDLSEDYLPVFQTSRNIKRNSSNMLSTTDELPSNSQQLKKKISINELRKMQKAKKKLNFSNNGNGTLENPNSYGLLTNKSIGFQLNGENSMNNPFPEHINSNNFEPNEKSINTNSNSIISGMNNIFDHYFKNRKNIVNQEFLNQSSSVNKLDTENFSIKNEINLISNIPLIWNEESNFIFEDYNENAISNGKTIIDFFKKNLVSYIFEMNLHETHQNSILNLFDNEQKKRNLILFDTLFDIFSKFSNDNNKDFYIILKNSVICFKHFSNESEIDVPYVVISCQNRNWAEFLDKYGKIVDFNKKNLGIKFSKIEKQRESEFEIESEIEQFFNLNFGEELIIIKNKMVNYYFLL